MFELFQGDSFCRVLYFSLLIPLRDIRFKLMQREKIERFSLPLTFFPNRILVGFCAKYKKLNKVHTFR